MTNQAQTMTFDFPSFFAGLGAPKTNTMPRLIADNKNDDDIKMNNNTNNQMNTNNLQDMNGEDMDFDEDENEEYEKPPLSASV